MENNAEDIVVILAGYKDRMDKFFSFIPGMSSRVGNHIDFPNYKPDELQDIAMLMAKDQDYKLTPEASEMFKEYIGKKASLPFFANARSVRNAVDRSRMNSAIRIFNRGLQGDGMVTTEEL